MEEFTKKTEGINITRKYTSTMHNGRSSGMTQAQQVHVGQGDLRSRQSIVQTRIGADAHIKRPSAHGAGQQRAGSSDISDRSTRILDRVVTLCIFMLFFGLPLFFLNVTYQGINFEKQYYFYFWSFCGIVAMIARGMLSGKIELSRTSLDVPLGILWISALISTVFSVDKYHSVFGFFDHPVSGFVSITALILAYYLVIMHITKERIMLLWWAIVTGGGIVTIWSFLATMRLVPVSVLEHVVASLTGSFTSLAIFLGMLLPIFIISFAIIGGDIRGSIRAKIVFGLLAILVILNMITLSVLHGYVLWYVVLGAVAVLLIFMISRSVKVSQTISTVTVMIFLVLFGLMSWGQPIIARTAIQPEALVDYHISTAIALDALKERPLFGSGPSTYGYNFSLYRPKELNNSGRYDLRFFSDRGMALESVSTLGIIGSVVLIVIFLTYVSTVIHAFIRTRDDEIKIISLGLFVASLVGIVYALFWSVDGTIILYGGLISAFLIGVLRSVSDEGVMKNRFTLSISSSPQHALSFAFVSILIAVGMIFGFVTLGKMFVADVHAGKALRARNANDLERSSLLFQKAVLLNGREGRYYTVISQYGLDLANIESAKPDGERNDESIKTYINGAASTASVGRELMPNDVLANETKGFIFENSGGYVGDALNIAIDAYTKAGRLEPQNPYLDIALGKLKLVEAESKGDAIEEKKRLINEAKVIFEMAREKTVFDHNGRSLSIFAPAHYYISVVEEALENTDAAIESMTNALQVAALDGAVDQNQVTARQVNYGYNLARLLQKRGSDEDMALAERLLLEIMQVNDQDVNVHLSLGLLYERTNRKDQAIQEYKKILAIIPESADPKMRENVQQLIDTIEQGGNNYTQTQIDTESDNMTSTETDIGEDLEKPSLLIIQAQGGDSAQSIQSSLMQDGYSVEIRDEEERSDNGVTVMHKGSVDPEVVRAVETSVQKAYATVATERNDQETNIYNHDVVIIVGGETAGNTDQE